MWQAFSRVKSYCWTIVCHHLSRDARRCHSRWSSLSLLSEDWNHWKVNVYKFNRWDPSQSIKALETSRSNSSSTKNRSIFLGWFQNQSKQMKIERLIHQRCNSIIQYRRGEVPEQRPCSHIYWQTQECDGKSDLIPSALPEACRMIMNSYQWLP